MKWRLRIIFMLVITTSVFSQNNPPSITITGDQVYCINSEASIISTVSITDEDAADTSLDEVNIQISEGYQIGLDLLTYNGTNPDITANWDVNEGKLTLIGPASFSAFETALLNVTFSTTQTVLTTNRSISVNLGNANFLPETGHYYFYVPSLNISWSQARAEAENQTYFGLQGYLVTITSIEEAQISGEQSPGTGWIGASDEQVEGTWEWVTGPENGQVFWIGTANGAAQNDAFEFWNTAEPNQSGNEDYAHITDSSIGIAGSWNDLPNVGPTAGPYQPRGYIVEFGGMPGDPEINLSASTNLFMPETLVENQVVCDGEVAVLSVATNADSANWYATQTSTTALSTDLTYAASFNESTTLWLEPVYADCATQFDRIEVFVDVIENPIANNILITECSNDNTIDITDFELDNYIDQIIEGNLETNLSVNFYSDEDLTTPIDGNIYTNNFNFEVIYAEVINTQTQCSSIAELTLEAIFIDLGQAELSICDDEDADGQTLFNLSEADDLVLPVGLEDLNVTYFESFENALSQTDPLPNDYSNNTNNQVIYTRVNDASSCLGLGRLVLKVNPLPVTNNDELYYCLDQFPDPVIITAGIDDSNLEEFTYLWSTGATTSQIEVNESGLYTVTITNLNGCQAERQISVLESEKPSINEVMVNDFSNNNSITIVASGVTSSDYEYSIDGNIYQNSGTFNNLFESEFTVYVRDKYGCGEVSEFVFILDYPEFFTPNGDGINDRWQIINVNTRTFNKILIFDRYGKVVKDLNPTSLGWDGTYNGKLLPANDYWFSLEYFDREGNVSIFKSHFTLKR